MQKNRKRRIDWRIFGGLMGIGSLLIVGGVAVFVVDQLSDDGLGSEAA
ncbi:MAG: hypothetical protein V4480_04345 [Patescibacteria group bacterium]